MWPFRRKLKPAPEPGLAPSHQAAGQTAIAPTRPRTADDILRQLEAEARTKPEPIAPDEGPIDPNLARCLLAEGPLTRELLDRQARVAGKGDSYLGRLLADTHAVSEVGLLALLATGYRVPKVDLKQCKVHVPTARSIPSETALKYKMVPIDRVGDIVCVVFSGEPNPKGIEAIRRETGSYVKLLRCPPHHLLILLRRLYATDEAGRGEAAPQAVQAVAISKREYDQAKASPAAKAEARWEAHFASKGPIRASRLGRR